MQLNVREVWLFLSIFSAYSVTKNYGRHTHHSSKFANKETSTPGRQTTFSTESPDSTVLTEELDDLFNWLDDPESQPETSFTPPVTSEQLPQSNSFDAIGNDPTGSQTDVGNDTVEGTDTSIKRIMSDIRLQAVRGQQYAENVNINYGYSTYK